ncbi:hypothetical protein GIB67_013129, partial [Kingdonia uniflora]
MPSNVPKHDRKSPVCRSVLGEFFSEVRDAGFYVFFNIRRYSTLEFKDLEYNRRTSRFPEEFHSTNFVHVLWDED